MIWYINTNSYGQCTIKKNFYKTWTVVLVYPDFNLWASYKTYILQLQMKIEL